VVAQEKTFELVSEAKKFAIKESEPGRVKVPIKIVSKDNLNVDINQQAPN